MIRFPNYQNTVNQLLFAMAFFHDLPEVSCLWRLIFATKPYLALLSVSYKQFNVLDKVGSFMCKGC